MAEDEKKPSALTQFITSVVERLGLPTAFLLFGGWFVYTGIVRPIVDTTKEAISSIAETNRMLEEAQREDDAKDADAIRDVLSGISQLGAKVDLLRETISTHYSQEK